MNDEERLRLLQIIKHLVNAQDNEFHRSDYCNECDEAHELTKDLP